MKKKKADSFTCFLAALCTLIFFLLIRLFLGMQEERRTYTALVSLGDLTYDNDFLKSASKIIGIQAVYTHGVEISIEVKHLVRVHLRDLYRDLLLDKALTFASDIFLVKVDHNLVIECLFVTYHIRHFCAQRHDNIDLLCVS